MQTFHAIKADQILHDLLRAVRLQWINTDYKLLQSTTRAKLLGNGNKQTVASKNITNYSYGPILAINITFAFGNNNFQILFIINNKCDVSPSSLCVKWEWLFVPFSVCHL